MSNRTASSASWVQGMRRSPWLAWCLGLAGVTLAAPGWAGTIWDGGGLADTNWGTATNWDSDTAPLFNGAESLTVTTGFGANTAMTLGADRSIARITFGGGATAISLSGNILQLTSTTTSNAAGAALWNAATADNVTATVNSNLLLKSGTAGSYTGYFRENNNSNGGTRFSGTITQGAGENWTLRFNRSGARGTFFLNNSANSIFAIRNDGADVYSEVAGAFGGASLTLAGSLTGTRTGDHYNGANAVSNAITLAANAGWNSTVQTRLTGTLAQSTFALTYGAGTSPSSGSLTRLEFSSISGTGTTTLSGATIAPSAMNQFASDTLNLGNTTSGALGVIVLSGATGNNLPTWDDFVAARTYNAAGGANTWRINVNAGTAANVYNAGGFAARGANLVIPNQAAANAGGLANTTFTRNFILGSTATLDGSQYADKSVRIDTDIAYGSVAGGQRYFGAAFNPSDSKSATALTILGPVHEISGQITGDSVILYPTGAQGQGPTTFGVIRISNPNNSLTGASRWILGGNRTAFTTMGGGSIAAASNMGDLSSIALIFTSDAAFGGATEVQVSSQTSSGTSTSGTLLLEDTNNAGSTTFARAVNISNTSASASPAAFGSFGGDVVYTGTLTFGGSIGSYLVHAQTGSTLAFSSGATFTNNNSAATTYRKTGAGKLIINSLAVGGTQATNNWEVQAGEMAVNSTLPTGNVTVFNGSTLAGIGTVTGNVTYSTGGGNLNPGASPGVLDITGNLTLTSLTTVHVELGGATPGDGNGFYDQINVSGTAALANAVLNVTTHGGYNPAAGVFYILSRNAGSGTFFGLTEGALVQIDGGVRTGQITYLANWTGTQAGSSLTGGNDVAIYNVTAIPEPASLALLALGGLLMIPNRKRR